MNIQHSLERHVDKHRITIEYVAHEFRGETKWMWDLAMALLQVIAAIQRGRMFDTTGHGRGDGLIFDPTLEHAFRYLRSRSPEAATLLALVVDAERKT